MAFDNRDRLLARLEALEAQAAAGGGTERIAKRHEDGKLTARERVDILLDPGSFLEMDAFVTHQCDDFGMDTQVVPGDGVITGFGRIGGRAVCVYAQDFTVLGGSLGVAHAGKICKVQDMALKVGIPIIGLNDSGGARIQEGGVALSGYAEIFLRNTLASGVIPQISAILGPCAGGAVYSPGITDFVLMAERGSHMFITGPDVIRTVTHEEVTKEALGGAALHARTSGVAHFVTPDEQGVLALIRELMTYLPQNNVSEPPVLPTQDPPDRADPALDEIVPTESSCPYDIREIISRVVDDGRYLEVHQFHAENIVCAFARLTGRTIGIVANQPAVLAGCLDIDASVKAARFVRFCDAFGIPLVTLVDTPGFLPGTDQESGGIIRHGAKLVYAYAEATVPKLTVICRKAYGGAYIVMSSRHMRGDFNLAYPTAEIAVMGSEGAVNILDRRAIDASSDPGAERKDRIDAYRERFANPYQAAEWGFVDAVIRPRDTRRYLASALATMGDKRDSNPPKKHGNIPL
jgi:propionyl-CoA carboxylase beta chain